MVATATSIGAAYDYVLNKLSGDPRVQAVFTRPKQDDPRVWILTEPLENKEELTLYGIQTELFERFPDAGVLVHILHRGTFDNDLFELVPSDAERQSFSRA